MYDSASVKDSCLFVVILGLFVSRALAASAACQADWDWVSDNYSRFSKWFHLSGEGAN